MVMHLSVLMLFSLCKWLGMHYHLLAHSVIDSMVLWYL
jgi:hypothetical protein